MTPARDPKQLFFLITWLRSLGWDALASERIAGAGLDVTEQEPIAADNPLLAMDNVIITPHALCWTDECFHDIAATALESIVAFSLGERPVHLINPAVMR